MSKLFFLVILQAGDGNEDGLSYCDGDASALLIMLHFENDY